MGLTKPWLTGLLLAGLVIVFTGARVLNDVAWLSLPLVLLGSAALLTATIWRTLLWCRARGDSRPVEAIFALGYAGCTVALAGYLPGTEGGVDLLGLEFDGIRGQLRFQRFFLVASPILLAISLFAVLGAQWALARGGTEGASQVDLMRVRETVANTASVALAGAALMLIGYVTSELNRTADFSYFKTSTPGDAVREIVRNMDGTIEAALFFPEVNPVKDEVRTYLDELARATDKVTVAEYDRFADPEAAADFGARGDGSLFLRVDGRSERIGLATELDSARARLRVLDRYVQQSLLQLNRDRRFVYLSKGHGEFNDPLTAEEPEDGQPPSLRQRWTPGMEREMGPPLGALREMLDFLNYEVRDIGIGEGLGDRIPDDAAMVMILGPERPFLDAELNAVRRYLDRGGSLLLAMETGSDFPVESLRDYLGVDYNPAMTIDDRAYFPGSPPSIADRRFIITNNFSTHPAVTTGSRSGSEILMVGPGSFQAAEDATGLRVSPVIRSLSSSYLDLNGDYRFDEGTEAQDRYGLAMAVERVPEPQETTGGDAEADSTEPDSTQSDAQNTDSTSADTAQTDAGEAIEAGVDSPDVETADDEPPTPSEVTAEPDAAPAMRALVYGDTEIFSDAILARLRINSFVIADGVRWLGREEQFSGEVESEEDVPILHTRDENVGWFYAIIFGAPAMVLVVGVFMLYGRRRPASGASRDEEGSGGTGGGDGDAPVTPGGGIA